MVAGLRAAARRAAAMLSAPASRRVVVTRLRMQARTAGALPVRARWASSPKVMSRTQWMLFSMAQCPRTSWASRASSASAGVRLVMPCTVSLRSRWPSSPPV